LYRNLKLAEITARGQVEVTSLLPEKSYVVETLSVFSS